MRIVKSQQVLIDNPTALLKLAKAIMTKPERTEGDLQIGDKVACPFDSIGIIQDIQDHLPWNNRIIVKFTKPNTLFHRQNAKEDFTPDQLKRII